MYSQLHRFNVIIWRHEYEMNWREAAANYSLGCIVLDLLSIYSKSDRKLDRSMSDPLLNFVC